MFEAIIWLFVIGIGITVLAKVVEMIGLVIELVVGIVDIIAEITRGDR